MRLTPLDWIVVAGSLLVAFAPALFYARRAGRGTAEFFASGRTAPWWLIGTSMVATTFSTDTPNLVTNMVRTKGVADNWEWWAFLLTGMATVFFYARLWRRSGVLTDLEFYELRYSGPSATFLRGFRAVYLGLCFNCVIMASVTLAAAKIANVMLGWDRLTTVIACSVICMIFAATSGLWGVLTTDLVQFVIAMAGVIVAAIYALRHPAVGGLSGLLEKSDPTTLRVVPDFASQWDVALGAMIVPLAVQWWSVWYPGAEPGGGSYIAQRMLAARSERDALVGTLWFNLAHYALRPWPWIIVALCSLLVYPTLDDLRAALPGLDPALVGHDMAYPAMLALLPHGLLGLLVASLLAAYVSTMTTHMNWGASYLVNDLYRRFVLGDRTVHRAPSDAPSPTADAARCAVPTSRAARRSGADERHLVRAGRLVSALLMVVAGGLTFLLTTAKDAFDLMLSIGAGTGLLYLLRWYWWRINAWSEIVAMASSFLCAATLFALRRAGSDVSTHAGLIASVAFTTLAWLAATFLTPPTDRETLIRFCRLVRPAGAGWRAVRAAAGAPLAGDSLTQSLSGFLLGCAFVYAALFGTGFVIYGQAAGAAVCAIVVAVSGLLLTRLLRKLWTGAGQTGAARGPGSEED